MPTTPNLRAEWGHRLQERREQAGLSIGEIARKVGTDKSAYRRIELGEVGSRGTGDDLKMRIAAALACRVEDIWTYPARAAS